MAWVIFLNRKILIFTRRISSKKELAFLMSWLLTIMALMFLRPIMFSLTKWVIFLLYRLFFSAFVLMRYIVGLNKKNRIKPRKSVNKVIDKEMLMAIKIYITKLVIIMIILLNSCKKLEPYWTSFIKVFSK